MADSTTRVYRKHRPFWDWVGKTDTCWNWVGSISKLGYGIYAGRLAHRRAYEELAGPIPAGLTLDHLCRNTLCVNPAHLEPVTGAENTLRGFGPTAINSRKTHCIRGHPFAGDNLKVYMRDGTLRRECVTCARERHRERDRQWRTRLQRVRQQLYA